MSEPRDHEAVKSIRWKDDHAVLIDQTRLPQETIYIQISTVEGMHEAIQNLRIRGAPAIGIAAAYGFYLGIRSFDGNSFKKFWHQARETADYLSSARPTAVNLNWAIKQLKQGIRKRNEQPVEQIKSWVLQQARKIHQQDKEICKQIGLNGISVIPGEANILTHCNTGSLATGQYGTALSVIYHANSADLNPHVWVDETRPLLQGARLTTWELIHANISCSLITDSTAGSLMQQGKVDLVIVGTDRVAANGDVANKIGTYPLAVLANRHEIPFYVAAPLSSIDLQVPTGDDIPIEERSGKEITHINNHAIAPENTNTYSPAFDVTPYSLVDGFITERRIVTENFYSNFKQLKKEGDQSLEVDKEKAPTE